MVWDFRKNCHRKPENVIGFLESPEHTVIEGCSFILFALTQVFAHAANTGYDLIYFEETKDKKRLRKIKCTMKFFNQ